MKIVDWIAGGLTVVGIVPLVGLPGMIPLIAAVPMMELIYWGRFTRALEASSDDVWGVVLILTLVWTPALSPIWRGVGRWKPGLSFWKHFWWTCLGMWIWAVITTWAVAELTIKPRQLMI